MKMIFNMNIYLILYLIFSELFIFGVIFRNEDISTFLKLMMLLFAPLFVPFLLGLAVSKVGNL